MSLQFLSHGFQFAVPKSHFRKLFSLAFRMMTSSGLFEYSLQLFSICIVNVHCQLGAFDQGAEVRRDWSRPLRGQWSRAFQSCC